jgi:hypothetical protein
MKELTTASMWCPGASLGALTSKAGMSFSFMGIMLASPRSIKDSYCGTGRGSAWRSSCNGLTAWTPQRSRSRKEATQTFRFPKTPCRLIPRPVGTGQQSLQADIGTPSTRGIRTSSGLHQPNDMG